MTCKTHPYANSVGVCATCLRQRLAALIASQNKLSAAGGGGAAGGEPDSNSSPANPHLIFPKSTSPYFSARRSPPFFNTPPAAGDFSRRNPLSLLYSAFRHSRSESWFSALIRRKNSKITVKKFGSSRPLDRGLSPDGEDSTVGRLPGPTPVRRTGGGGRGSSSFAVCLSPMVRSNNGRIGRHVCHEDQRSDGVNRSRKLAEFGRFK